MNFKLSHDKLEQKIIELEETIISQNAILAAIPDLMFKLNEEGKYLDIWAQDPDELAASKELLLRRMVSEMLPADAVAQVMIALREAKDKGRSHGQQIQLVTPKGEQWFELSTSLEANDSTPRQFIMLSRNITKRKQAEAKILHEKHFTETVISQLPGSFYMFTENGHMLRWNENLEKVTGYSASEVQQMNALDFFPVDEKEKVHRRIQEVFVKGLSQVEANFLTKTGQKIPHVLTGARTEYDGVTYLLGVGLDITERIQAETNLRAERERFKVTLHSIGDGVIATDRESRVTLMNPVAERLTGWTDMESRNQNLEKVFRIVNETTRKSCLNPVQQVIDSGKIVGLANDTLLISRDGTERVIADSGAPIRDTENQIIGVVLVFRDITETRKMENELIKFEKLESLGVLAGGIAHDFNNFLAGIIGNLSLAKLDCRPADPIYPALLEMEKAASRAKNLTQQLLTFSRGGNPVKKHAHLAHLFQEAATFAVRGSNIRCEFEFTKQPLITEVDEGQIAQVVHNLILNAIQAMPEGGIVKIEGKKINVSSSNPLSLTPGEYVKVSIRDHGTGIKKEHLKKVFDPYFTTKQTGSGLGLAIVYSIIDKHNGCITVNSELGKGTTVNLILPAIDDANVEAPAAHSPIVSGKGRILVMDDEQFIRDLLSKMLDKLGYECTPARDGAQAIDKYQRALETGQPFDAVILDLTIPGGIGGKETVKNLLQLDANVRAIVSSGYSNDPVISNFEHYGFRGTINKPFLIQELSEVLHRIVPD